LVFHLLAVFDHGFLGLLRVERFFVGRVASLSPVDVHHGGHPNYTRLGRLLGSPYNHAYCPTHLKQRALSVWAFLPSAITNLALVLLSAVPILLGSATQQTRISRYLA
jgi:hypothetical protein